MSKKINRETQNKYQSELTRLSPFPDNTRGYRVYSLQAAANWFLENRDPGGVLCCHPNGHNQKCLTYREAELFFVGPSAKQTSTIAPLIAPNDRTI